MKSRTLTKEDIAYPNLTPQIEAMKRDTTLFEFSEKTTEGKLHYDDKGRAAFFIGSDMHGTRVKIIMLFCFPVFYDILTDTNHHIIEPENEGELN